MSAHARPRSSHSPTPPLVSRPATVVALGIAVSTLTVATVFQAPAQAGESPATALATSTVDAAAVVTPTPTDPADTRLARLVEVQQKRLMHQEEREARLARRERREKLQVRLERRERRADARAAARAAARAPRWVMPVPGAGWSASFGEAGSMWSSGYHTGQDFTAPSGTPVHAVSAGTITSATWSDAYGNIIEITHPNGDQSWYAHMSSFERTSGTVSAGDVIGYVGCTGNCFGDHLHFEYHPGGGQAADPVAWLHRNGL